MPLMKNEEFTAWAIESIKHYLPDNWKNAEIDVHQVKKTGSVYLSMTVRQKDQMTAPAINLEAEYEAYLTGASLDAIGLHMASIVQSEMPNFDMDIFGDYAKIKDKLFIRVCNAYDNLEMLEMVPHVRFNDLAITYHILVNDSHDSIASATITNDMKESFGVDNKTLREDAIESSQKLFPGKVSPMFSVMQELTGIEMERSPMDNSMVIVTNDIGVNGAAVLFYPDVKEEIASLLGGDYYVLPSSIHEVIAVPVTLGNGYKMLERMVQTVNENQVDKAEQLSDRVYRYEAKTHKLELAADQEARLRKEKQKAKDYER